MFLIEQALSAIDTIYEELIGLQLSPAWNDSVKPALLNWISQVKE